jgi:hypothetical protein
MEPALYRKESILPLWASNKNILPTENIPACSHCKQPRTFEMQIMPQLFDKIEELRLVDWDTIAVYTCTNPICLPDFSKDEYYLDDFGYIQFSTDF